MLYRQITNSLRGFAQRVQRNKQRTEKKIADLEKFRGSTYYDEERERILTDGEKERASIAEAARRELIPFLDTMRQNCKKGYTEPPTPSQAATLDLLGKLDRLTIADVQLYADEMKNSPLCLRMLQQIAHAHQITLHIPDPEALLHAVDIAEAQIAQYIAGYRADTDKTGSVLERSLTPFLFLDDAGARETPYESLENVDRLIWEKILLDGIATPEDFEGKTQSPKAQFYFKDVAAMREFINAATEGLTGPAKTDVVNMILANCPDSYGSAYRYWQSTGEETELNQ